MQVAEDSWVGRCESREGPTASVRMVLCSGNSGAGGSAPVRYTDEAGQDWWVKATSSPQGERVPVTEQIIGGLGRLIGAPVCEVAVAEIDAAVEYGNCTAGLHHASRDVADAIELRGQLEHRHDNQNRTRHPGIYALFDWCWGGDPQWLYRVPDDWETHSHDHGWYLPPEGPTWDVASLRASVDDPHVLPSPPDDLDPIARDQVADRLDALAWQDVARVLRAVPAEWSVTDDELDVLGWFLERRAPLVAARMRAL